MAETVTFNDNAADKYDKDIYNSTVEKGWNIVPLMPSVRGDIPIASEQKPGHVYAVYPKTAGLITLGRYTDNTNLVPVSITADAENVIVDLAAFTVDFTNCVTDVDTVLLDIDLTGITDVDNLFYQDPYLMKVSADLPEVTKTDYLFSSSPELTNIDNISAVNATSTAGMFYGCDKLKKINRGMDFRKSETSFGSTLDFSSCIALEEIRPRILLNPTIATGDIDYIFSDLPLLKSISIDLGGSSTNMTMYYTFGDCTSLTNVEIINSQICTAFDDTFSNCSSLKNIELDVSKSTSFNSMFWRCENLETVTLNALNGYQENLDISYMFEDCYKLKSVIGVIDYSKSNSKIGDRTFDNCALLQDLQIKGINNDADFSKCPSLSADSIHYILNNLTDLSIGDTPLSYPSKVIKFNDACRTRILPSDAIEANRKMFIIEPEASYIQFQYSAGTTPSLSDFTITGTEYTSEVIGDRVIISYADKITNIAYTSENITGIVGSGLLSLTNMGGANCKQPMSLASIEIYGENQIANVDSMFENNTNITAIHRLDLNNVASAKNMFKGCTALTDVSEAGIRYSISLKNATNVSHMFDGCTALTNVKSIDIRSATDVSYLFNGCSSLITSDNIILANKDIQINMEYCFNGCSKLTSFYTNTPERFDNHSGYNSDMSCVTNLSHAFDNCSALTEPYLCNLNATIDLSQTTISPYYIEYTLKNVLVVEAKSIAFPTNFDMYIMQSDYNNAVSKGWTITPVPTPKITFRSDYNNDMVSSITINGSGYSSHYDPKMYRLTIYNIENVTSVVYGDINGLREVEIYDAVNLTHLGKSGSYNTQPTSVKTFILKGNNKISSMNRMFYNKKSSFEKIDIDVDSNCKSMNSMFYGCTYLNLTLDNFKLNNAHPTDTSYMFRNCSNMKYAPILDTSNTKYLKEMFLGCDALETIPTLDLASANSSNTDPANSGTYRMFPSPTSNQVLSSIDLRNIHASVTIPSINLSPEQIHNIFINLMDMRNSGRDIVYLDLYVGLDEQKKAELIEKITVEDYEKAIKYGWSVNPVKKNHIDINDTMSYVKITSEELEELRPEYMKIVDPTDSYRVSMDTNTIIISNAENITELNPDAVKNNSGEYMSVEINNLTNLSTLYPVIHAKSFKLKGNNSIRNAENLFKDCIYLNSIETLDLQSITNMNYMFGNCGLLVTIPAIDSSTVETSYYAFSECTSLKSIPLLNMINVNNTTNMFYNCDKLESLNIINLKKGLDLTSSINLTGASIHNILSNVQTISTKETIKFAPTLKSLIVLEDYMHAIEAGWNVTPASDLPLPDPNSSYIKLAYPSSVSPSVNQATVVDPEQKAYVGISNGSLYVYEASTVTNVVYTSNDVTEVYCKDAPNIQYIGTAENSNKQSNKIQSFVVDGTNNITDASYMFSECSSITDIRFDTSKLTNMVFMFNGCSVLTTIPNLNTSSITNMNGMFKGCAALTTIPQLNYSSVESMDNMFNGSGIITLPDLSTMTKTISVTNLFYGCNGITSVVFDCSHFNTMKYTFSHCENITTAQLTNTTNIIEFIGNFEYCTKLSTVNEIDLINAVKGQNMSIEMQEVGLNFANCDVLQTANIKNLKISEMFVDMNSGTALPLSKESIHYILKNVSDMGINVLDIMMSENPSATPDISKMRALGFNSNNDGKITLSDYMNATMKGWLIMPMLLQEQINVASFTYKEGSTVSASDFSFTTIPNTTYEPVYTITEQTIEFVNIVNVSEIVYPETISEIVMMNPDNLSRITYDATISGSRLSSNVVSYINMNVQNPLASMDISNIAQNCTNLQRFMSMAPTVNEKYSFDGCSNLTSCTLYIGDQPADQKFDHLFDECTQLSSLTLMGVSNTIDLSALTNLDKASVNNILRKLLSALEPDVSTITFDPSKKDLIEEDAYLMARAMKWVVIPGLDNVSSYIKFTYKDGTTPSVSDFTVTGTEYTSTITGQDIIFENAYLITDIVYSSENIIKVDAHNIISATHIGKTGTYSTQPASVVEFTLYGKNQIQDVSRMFENCTNLVTVHRLDAFYGNTTATRMFYGCTSLESLPELNTGRLSNMDYMFTNCTNLKTIKSIDLSGIYSQYYFDDIGFDSLTSLITLDISGFDTVSSTLTYDLSKLVSLSADSIHNILYDLPTLSELVKPSRTIKFADISVASIQQSDYISATNKGWTILPNVSLDPPTADSVLTFTYKAGTAPIDLSGFAISSLNDHTVDLSQPDKVIFNMATNIVAIRYPDDQNIIGISIENMRNLTSIICKKYEGDIGDSPNRQTTSLTSFKISGINKMTNLKYLLFLCDGLTDATLDLTTFDTSNVTIMDTMFGGCKGLTTLDLSHFNVSNVTSVSGIFWHCEKLTSINLASWDTSNIVTFSSMFNGCKALTSLDVSHFNTDSADDMDSMFADCSKLTSIDVSHFNTSGVTTMMTMFGGCSSLTSLDLSTWDTSNLNNITQMFEFVRLSTLDLSTFKTTRLRYMYSTFFGANIGTLNMSTFDTSRVVEMASMFREASITNLNISALNTSNVTDMSFMFGNCYIGTSNLDFSTFNTSNVTNMNYMFYNNTWLTTIPSFDTSKVTTMIRAFENCQNATGTWTISYDGDVALSYDNLSIFDNTTKPITMRYKASNTIAANYAAPSNVTKEVIA